MASSVGPEVIQTLGLPTAVRVIGRHWTSILYPLMYPDKHRLSNAWQEGVS